MRSSSRPGTWIMALCLLTGLVLFCGCEWPWTFRDVTYVADKQVQRQWGGDYSKFGQALYATELRVRWVGQSVGLNPFFLAPVVDGPDEGSLYAVPIRHSTEVLFHFSPPPWGQCPDPEGDNLYCESFRINMEPGGKWLGFPGWSPSYGTTCDYSGNRTIASGDVDGDDIEDLIIASTVYFPYEGVVYVFDGNRFSGTSIDPSTGPIEIDASEADLILVGNWGAFDCGDDPAQDCDAWTDAPPALGQSIACGDVNGDGYDDIIMARPYDDHTQYLSVCKTCKEDDPPWPVVCDYDNGVNDLNFGAVAIKFGDWDIFDHEQEEIVENDGTYGWIETTLPYLHNFGVAIEGGAFPAGVLALACGDFDGDGKDDIVIGEPKFRRDPSYSDSFNEMSWCEGGGSSVYWPIQRGEVWNVRQEYVYVVYGRDKSSLRNGIDLGGGLGGQQVLRICGQQTVDDLKDGASPDGFGLDVAMGDINDDTREDLVIYAPFHDGFGLQYPDAGTIFILAGRVQQTGTVDVWDDPVALPRAVYGGDHADASWYPDTHPDYTWFPGAYGRVAVADVNRDGLGDVLWGQPGTETQGQTYTLDGVVYVINGDARFGDGGSTLRNGINFSHDNFVVDLASFTNDASWQDWAMWSRIVAEGHGDRLGACVAGTRSSVPTAPDFILVASAPLGANDQGEVYAIYEGGQKTDLPQTTILPP